MAVHKIKFFTGRASRYLAEKIVKSYGSELGDAEVLQFSDGEFQPYYNESIRGCTVFVIQSTFPSSDNLMELLMMIDAARRASAYKVIAVIPYFGWARQDRKDRPRVPIGAKLVANLLVAAGVDRVMTMDLHADQIQGFFDVPVDALYASGIFVPYIKNLGIAQFCAIALYNLLCQVTRSASCEKFNLMNSHCKFGFFIIAKIYIPELKSVYGGNNFSNSYKHFSIKPSISSRPTPFSLDE